MMDALNENVFLSIAAKDAAADHATDAMRAQMADSSKSD